MQLFPVILGKIFRTPVLKKTLAQQLLKLFHSSFFFMWVVLTQLTFTYTKSTIETLEKSVNYVKRNKKTLQWRHWRRSGVFNVNFRHISQQFLVFLLLNLNKQMLGWTLTCLISNESKLEISFNKYICRSLFQVVNFYLTSTVRNVTQNKKYFFILHFFPLFTFDPCREKTTNWAISFS